MTELFSRNKRTISEHISNIFNEGELQEKAVVRKFRTTALDGKSYQTNFMFPTGVGMNRRYDVFEMSELHTEAANNAALEKSLGSYFGAHLK